MIYVVIREGAGYEYNDEDGAATEVLSLVEAPEGFDFQDLIRAFEEAEAAEHGREYIVRKEEEKREEERRDALAQDHNRPRCCGDAFSVISTLLGRCACECHSGTCVLDNCLWHSGDFLDPGRVQRQIDLRMEPRLNFTKFVIERGFHPLEFKQVSV
jgi:hypothetical protein